MKGKKLIALVLCLLLTISLLPVSALAEGDGEEPAQPVDTTPPTADGEEPGEEPEEPGAELGDPDPADVDPDALSDDPDGLMGTTDVTYYLVGSMNDWTAQDADYKFTLNPSNNNEYMLTNVVLNTGIGAQVKVVDSNNNWYPDGMNNNLTISSDGTYNFYFRPDGQGGSGWHYGYIYYQVVNPPTYTVTLDAVLGSTHGTAMSGGSISYLNPGGVLRLLAPVDNIYGRPKPSEAGTLVRFRVEYDAGYTYTVTARKANNNTISLLEGDATSYQGRDAQEYIFNLPASDVTITAVFSESSTPVEHSVTIRPTLILPDGTRHYPMSDEEKTAAFATLSVTPASAAAGTTITVVTEPNEGYFIKHDLLSYNTFDGTLVKTGDYTYTFTMPDNDVILSTEVATGLDTGYYVQIDDADQSDWIPLVNSFPFYGGVTTVWSEKATLTAGQVLTAYYVSNPGATPVQKATLTADASGTQTIYYVAEGTGELHVSGLNGYYIVHANVTSTRPYGITEAEAFTLTDGMYVYDGPFKGEHWVCVAEFEDGTVVGTYPNVNNVNTRFVTPREDEVGQPYQGTGPECFPYDGAMGRAWFDPNGQGGPDYAGGYLKVRRLYTFEFDWNYTIINDADVHITSTPEEWALENDTVSFEVEPVEGFVINSVTITKETDGSDVSCEVQAGVYTFTMPADDVFVYITFAPEPEETGHTVIVMQPLLAQHGICGISPNGGENIDAGIPVTVTFTPDEGFAVDYVTSTVSEEGVDADVTTELINNAYSFTMPDWAVVIHVHWKTAEPPVVPVTGITVTPETASLTVGQTQQLTASIEPDNASNPAVTWTSGDETIATVDENGLVTAVAAGTATIYATSAADNTIQATCTVTVTAAPQNDYDAFVRTLDGYFGDYNCLNWTILVKDEFADPQFSLTINGEARFEVTSQEAFDQNRYACWMKKGTPSASTEYPGYTQYVISVKLFAKQYNWQTAFTIQSGERTLRIRSYEYLAGGVQGNVDTSVSYSLVDYAALLARIYRELGYSALSEKWGTLARTMGDFSNALNAAIPS